MIKADIKKDKSSADIYAEMGYESREDYLDQMAEEYGVDCETVYAIAELLGETEDFDGLVSTLEDLSI